MTARTEDLFLLAIKYVSQRRRRQEIGASSAKTYRTTLLAFAGSPGVPTKASNLRRGHIERWVESRHACSPATVRSQLSIVRSFCQWLATEGYRRTDPTLGIRAPRQPRYLPRGLRATQVCTVLQKAADERLALLESLGVQEGLRCCEMAGLQVHDVDEVERQLAVMVSKGGDQRLLALSDETLDRIHEYLAEHPAAAGPLIRSYNHPTRGISAGHISRLLSNAMHEAGVNESGHSLRHTCASDMLRHGAHLRDVQSALGHRSIQSTERYLPLQVKSLREAMGGRTYRNLEDGADR
jgi:site-specific recombinase XerD